MTLYTKKIRQIAAKIKCDWKQTKKKIMPIHAYTYNKKRTWPTQIGSGDKTEYIHHQHNVSPAEYEAAALTYSSTCA